MKRENLRKAGKIIDRMERLEARIDYSERCLNRTPEEDNKKIIIYVYPGNNANDYTSVPLSNELAAVILPVLLKQTEDKLKELATELETL